MMKILYIALLMAVANSAKAQDSLQNYIAEAVRQSKELAALNNSFRAAETASVAAGTLPDPELSMGFYPKAMEHVGGKQVLTAQIMQMFPWFGTLRSARKAKEWRTEAARQRLREGVLEVVYKVQRQWYAMLAARERVRSLDANIALLRSIQKVALYNYTSAAAAKGVRMSDQLRLDAELSLLEERQMSAQSELDLLSRQFNVMLRRNETSPLHLPDSILLQPVDAFAWEENVVNGNPLLLQQKAESEAYKAESERARRMGMPMIGVGVEYMLNKKRDAHAFGVMPDMNGMDMFMPMIKVSLPIYRRKTTAAVGSARLMQASAEAAYLQKRDELRSRWLEIKQQAEDVQRKIKLYEKQELLLTKTMQLMQTEYANGAAQLTDILQTSRELVDYALKKYEAQARYGEITAAYQRLTANGTSAYSE